MSALIKVFKMSSSISGMDFNDLAGDLLNSRAWQFILKNVKIKKDKYKVESAHDLDDLKYRLGLSTRQLKFMVSHFRKKKRFSIYPNIE